jgi:hypothetical protein
MMWRAILMAATLAFLAACSTSSGILPAGPDTYTLTEHRAPVLGGASEAQKSALTEANNFCTEKGRVFVPAMMQPGGHNPYGQTEYGVTFRCLRPDDPAIAKFKLERSPDVVIEQRDR